MRDCLRLPKTCGQESQQIELAGNIIPGMYQSGIELTNLGDGVNKDEREN